MNLTATLTSREGMSTNVWGNPLWFVLHTMAMAFPLDDDGRRGEYRRFMESLGAVLPCGSCRDNYPGNYRDAAAATRDAVGPGPYESRAAFIYFVWALHDMVNRTLGKVSPSPTVEEVIERFESFRAHCSQRHADAGDHTGCTELPPHRVGHKAQTFIHVRPRRLCDDKDASDHVIVDDACRCRPKETRVVPRGRYRVEPLRDEEGIVVTADPTGRWLDDGLFLRTEPRHPEEEPLTQRPIRIDRGDGVVHLRPATTDADMVGDPFLFLG